MNAATWQVLRTAFKCRSPMLSMYLVGGISGSASYRVFVDGPSFVNSVPWFAGLALAALPLWLASGVIAQNHPSLARHTPGHTETLLKTLRWLTLSPLALVLLAIAIWLPSKLAAGPFVVGVALLFNAISFSSVRPALAAGFFLAGMALIAFLDVAEHVLAGPIALWAPLAIALTGWGLQFAIRSGDRAHRERQQKQQVSTDLERLLTNEKRAGARHFGPGTTGAFMRLINWPIQRLVQSQKGRPVVDEADAMRRALWLAAPSQLPRTQLVVLAPVAVMCVLLAGLDIMTTEVSSATQPLLVSFFGVMGVHLLSAWSLGPELWHGRREQALLVLLPRMPRAQHFNPILRRQLLRTMLLAWLQPSLVLLACALWIDASLVPHMLAACTALLPVHVHLASWRGQAARGPGQQTGPGAALSLLLAMGLLFGLLSQPASWAWAVTGLALLGSAALWRALAPRQTGYSWPVGRAEA